MERTIQGYPDYVIYSDGRIFGKRKKRFLKPQINKSGYPLVSLINENGKRKTFLVHRLIAMAFIPNPENKPCVDHIDCDRLNCNVLNLRWVTYSENNLNPISRKKYAHGNGMRGKYGKLHFASKPVLCYNRENVLIAKYDGVREASRQTAINRGDIGSCCRGIRKTAGNFIWRYGNI